MRCPSGFCAVCFFSKIVLVKKEFIVKNGVKGFKRVHVWIPKRTEGSDANTNFII